MANPSTTKAIMDNWIEKSKLENHVFNEYIALWIAFNAYYSSVTNGQSDRDSINTLKNNAELKQWYLSIANSKEISDLLALAPITNMKNNMEVIINGKEDYASVLAILYQIRNNLFHGSKADFVARDEAVVTMALPILKKIVIYCQGNYDKIEF